MPIRYISKGKGKNRKVFPIRQKKGVSVRSVSLQPTAIGKINKEQIKLINSGERSTFSKALNQVVMRAKRDDFVGQCKTCGRGFTKQDYINASKGMVGDDCLVGDRDDICYPCQLRKSRDEDYREERLLDEYFEYSKGGSPRTTGTRKGAIQYLISKGIDPQKAKLAVQDGFNAYDWLGHDQENITYIDGSDVPTHGHYE